MWFCCCWKWNSGEEEDVGRAWEDGGCRRRVLKFPACLSFSIKQQKYCPQHCFLGLFLLLTRSVSGPGGKLIPQNTTKKRRNIFCFLMEKKALHISSLFFFCFKSHSFTLTELIFPRAFMHFQAWKERGEEEKSTAIGNSEEWLNESQCYYRFTTCFVPLFSLFLRVCAVKHTQD